MTCLVGVGMVKNEADIIEASVRHNLRYLDRIILFDHDSSDATPRILRAMAQEGLPISLLSPRTDRREFAFWQGEFTTGLAKLAFTEHGADHVIPLDADEFLDGRSRASIAAALDKCPDEVASLEWRTFVPGLEDEPDMHPLDSLRWRVETELPQLSKIAISRRAASGDWFIARGNHAFCRRCGSEPGVHAATRVEGVRVAHLPLRSPRQLMTKVLVGWLARKLAYGVNAGSTHNSWHLRELFGRIVKGEAITPMDVRRYAIALYALNRPPSSNDDADFRLVEDRFARPIPLRYSESGSADPARFLAAWASDLVDSIVASRAGAR
jgi:hypothetical protein